ncbi:MAG: chemotaxis protein CheW [Nitrospira sp.]|nr:chemotaxis protein CheW [Nitrospira sp.]
MSLRGQRVESAALVPVERFLIVEIDARQFALPADLVQGLLTMEEQGSVDTLTVQGQDYAFFDLGGRLGLVHAADGPETRIALLAQAGLRVCVRVDRVHGLVEVERTRVVPLPGQFRGEERNWYAGLLLHGDGVAIGLHTRWLLSGATQRGGESMAQDQRLPLRLFDTSDRMRKGIAC